MVTKSFIFQGVTNKTHALALRDLFAIPDIERAILSVAFVSENGVKEVESALKLNSDKLVVYAGIRNNITSHQGLSLLFSIASKLYTVDTGSRSILFHPKLYLTVGKDHARMIIGSANLTLGGLNNNIEAGVLIDYDLRNEHDREAIREIENQLGLLPSNYPDNVTLIASTADIDKLLKNGRVADEAEIPLPRPTVTASGVGAEDNIPRMKLEVRPIRGQFLGGTKVVSNLKTKNKAGELAAPDRLLVPAAKGIDFELVWESKSLTRRDLTIPTAGRTNQTGSINLDKGLLPEAVDHRHYFRDVVFSELSWMTRSATVAEAYGKFQLIVKGISYGEFDLVIRHTTSSTSRAYLQKNAMTRLSWGPMRDYITRPDLIGRGLALYRDKVDAKCFVLEID